MASKTKKHSPEIIERKVHRLSQRQMDPDAVKILYRLHRNGFKGYLVGGGVRDLLLKKEPKDFDISTDATPKKIKTLFRNSRIIGKRFRLVHIYFRNRKVIEVSTFRAEQEPVPEEQNEDDQLIQQDNTFGTEKSDALRRDITINGMFYDIGTFSIIDYVGGYKDLQNKTIRIIGDPDTRFQEDPIRLIRVVRHAVRSGFSIESATRKSLQKNAHLIHKSATARIFLEFTKDLLGGHSAPILQQLAEHKILKELIPEFAAVPELFHKEHPFLKALNSFDRAIQKGENYSLSTILSLIVLFLSSPNITSGATPFPKGDLQNQILHCFGSIAVPRKDREYVEKILKTWNTVEHPKGALPDVSQLARRTSLKQTFEFAKCLGSDREALNLLQHAILERETFRKPSSSSGKKQKRRRSSGRKRS